MLEQVAAVVAAVVMSCWGLMILGAMLLELCRRADQQAVF